MSPEDDTKTLITIYNRRLQKLREQQALYGPATNPGILLEIEDVEEKLGKLQTALEYAMELPGSILVSTSQDSCKTFPWIRIIGATLLVIGGFSILIICGVADNPVFKPTTLSNIPTAEPDAAMTPGGSPEPAAPFVPSFNQVSEIAPQLTGCENRNTNPPPVNENPNQDTSYRQSPVTNIPLELLIEFPPVCYTLSGCGKRMVHHRLIDECDSSVTICWIPVTFGIIFDK